MPVALTVTGRATRVFVVGTFRVLGQTTLSHIGTDVHPHAVAVALAIALSLGTPSALASQKVLSTAFRAAASRCGSRGSSSCRRTTSRRTGTVSQGLDTNIKMAEKSLVAAIVVGGVHEASLEDTITKGRPFAVIKSTSSLDLHVGDGIPSTLHLKCKTIKPIIIDMDGDIVGCTVNATSNVTGSR